VCLGGVKVRCDAGGAARGGQHALPPPATRDLQPPLQVPHDRLRDVTRRFEWDVTTRSQKGCYHARGSLLPRRLGRPASLREWRQRGKPRRSKALSLPASLHTTVQRVHTCVQPHQCTPPHSRALPLETDYCEHRECGNPGTQKQLYKVTCISNDMHTTSAPTAAREGGLRRAAATCNMIHV